MHALHDWVRLIPVRRSSRYWKVCILISRIKEHPRKTRKFALLENFPLYGMPPHVKYLRYSVHYRVVRLWESSMRCVAFSWSDNYCVVCCRPIDVSYLMTTSTLCTARYGPSNLGCQAVNYTPPHYIDQGVHTTTLH